ncbi:NAD(P)H-hydrate dehydratase [Pseudemcibacter aquimaris]|uniref:NAD(P)H-hydrate dehydratase n=1 Tax=Pseudemcibacter aquimaris TaxID=2857064 RepID=UPI002011FE53|nr:NAD(P)H-hydrate dehydratase [Pseudemcibacter aquimaris]MCC3860849.1 NAD(P)H-hydrate dehydratase [Pseudemcibacter aquimaris]WDU59668.1 NAD(P)H-hydrate dehydratase [Pseudemcibacter aquimaris]
MNNNNKYAVLTTTQMGEADKITIDQLQDVGKTGADLMENAGLTVVREIVGCVDGRAALILCGPGNNGGDGFVIARHLKKHGWSVDVALLGSVEKLSGDARVMADFWEAEILNLTPDIFKDQDLIVDALFGTGLSKNIGGELAKVIETANHHPAYKIAVDIPSGVEGNTGKILGIAFYADKTVTFARKKPAHLIYPGKELCGDVIVTDIGINDRTIEAVEPNMFENYPALWLNAYPINSQDAHKYHHGHAVVVSGGCTKTGAARLAATSALRTGAGLVSVSSPEDALIVHASHLTSVMIRKRAELNVDLEDQRLNAWCIGPAAGVNGQTRKDVLSIIKANKRAVLDADALTVFEEGPLELFQAINTTDEDVILTPHAGEFARLFPYQKEEDKLSATLSAAKLSGAVVVYKGADTVIASPDGRCVINSHAPETLATAGSGDVLAGIITGLIAQNMPGFEAACAAVWMHSECANRIGVGLISEDLEKEIPFVLQNLLEN